MRIVDRESGGGKDLHRRTGRTVVSSTTSVRLSGRSAFAKAAQALALLLAAFLLLRVIGPWLIDLHNTPALILAVVLLVCGLFAIAWFAWALVAPFFRKG